MREMFIWDFAAGSVLDQIMDWIYSLLIGFLSEFFTMMNGMGADLFELPWVAALILFFSRLGWMLYAVGFIVAVFECAIEHQSGRGNIKDVGLNVLKGFFAVSLFTSVPVGLYREVVSLEGSLSGAIAGMGYRDGYENLTDAVQGTLENMQSLAFTAVVGVFCLVMIGYAVFKVFFSNLKRGGILLILIAVGSLYMFGIPRGYLDGFHGWCKQVVGLCLTTFLQSTILIAGLMVFREQLLLGLGLMLSAGEIPRLAGHFGMESGTRANLMGSIYAVQHALTLSRSIGQMIR